MRVRFEPLVGLTFVFLPMFLLIVGLGIWQLERLQWKLALINQITRNMSAAPIGLDEALALGDRAEYRPVTVTGRFEDFREVYVFTTGPNGTPVYHILTPLVLPDGRAILIDRGFIPTALQNPASRPGSEPHGVVRVMGVWRTPDKPGTFTPAPDLKNRVWYARDLAGIAQAENTKFVAPAILEARTSSANGFWPRAGQTRVDIPNDHLRYALTWFLLAVALVVFYFVYHHAQGRLKFGVGGNAERTGA